MTEVGIALTVAAVALAFLLYKKTSEQVQRLAILIFSATSALERAMPNKAEPFEEDEAEEPDDFSFGTSVNPRYVPRGKDTELGLEINDSLFSFVFRCRVTDSDGRVYRSRDFTPDKANTSISVRFPTDFPKGSSDSPGLYRAEWFELENSRVGEKETNRYFLIVSSWFAVLP
jgi:hypothetical protein